MNAAVRNLAEQGPLSKKGYQILWQCGGRFEKQHGTWAEAHGDPYLIVRGFIDRMDLAYDAASVIASRAGAMSIAELALVGKPTILVPSPHVAEDHQTKNARSVVDREGAVLLPDHRVERDLGKEIRSLLNDAERCTSMSEALRATARPEAAQRVAEEIQRLLGT